MVKIKNIIFDLKDVLFRYNELSSLFSQNNNNKLFEPIEKGLELLSICQVNKSCALFVCSNMSMTKLDKLKQEYPDILCSFNGIVTSSIAQVAKPDPKIFQYLLEKYNINAHECVFLDDQEVNTKSAESLGITSIHVTDFDYVKEQLKELLLN